MGFFINREKRRLDFLDIPCVLYIRIYTRVERVEACSIVE